MQSNRLSQLKGSCVCEVKSNLIHQCSFNQRLFCEIEICDLTSTIVLSTHIELYIYRKSRRHVTIVQRGLGPY